MNSFFEEILPEIDRETKRLEEHPVYESIHSIEELRKFMEVHVYAVWDFMSLLKALQIKTTCVEIPWTPNYRYQKVTRLINEIVLGEESDQDGEGGYLDHFSLYLRAMDEVGAPTEKISQLIMRIKNGEDLWSLLEGIPRPIAQFLDFNLQLALKSDVHCIASAFFFGREKIIPSMFTKIVDKIGLSHDSCPTLIYYLKRHIELDGDEHGEMAEKILENLCLDNPQKWQEVKITALKALKLRYHLWDFALQH